MTERYPDLFKVLIREIGQNGKGNVVLGKAMRVLPETELVEPVRNLLHRGPSRSRGAFNPHVYLVTERYKVDRFGQKRLGAILQRLAFRLCVAASQEMVSAMGQRSRRRLWALVYALPLLPESDGGLSK